MCYTLIIKDHLTSCDQMIITECTPISEVLASAIENGSRITFYVSVMIGYLLCTLFQIYALLHSLKFSREIFLLISRFFDQQ